MYPSLDMVQAPVPSFRMLHVFVLIDVPVTTFWPMSVDIVPESVLILAVAPAPGPFSTTPMWATSTELLLGINGELSA